MHARAVGAVAVCAPIRGLPAALAGDSTPHLHCNACLRAPSDVTPQLLGGPFWDPQTQDERENKVRSQPRLLVECCHSHPRGRGRQAGIGLELGMLPGGAESWSAA